MAYPADFKYTKEHEWILVEGDTGTIGITDHAQEALGDVAALGTHQRHHELVERHADGEDQCDQNGDEWRAACFWALQRPCGLSHQAEIGCG